MIDRHIKKFCCEDISLIENYNEATNDKTQTWDCHHRLETLNSDGEERMINLYVSELKALNMYWKRPACELIFLTRKEHRQLHNSDKILRKKISQINKGRVFFNNGEIEIKCEKCPEGFILGRLKSVIEKSSKGHVGMKHTEEFKKMMSEKFRGRFVSDETKIKRSNSIKGLKFFNNGVITIRARECPEGFVPGKLYKHIHTEESKLKMRKSAKLRKPLSKESRMKGTAKRIGCKWWNNGIRNVYKKNCPEGFVPGRIMKTKKGRENEC